MLQWGFVRNQSGLKRHPVCSSVGALCRNHRIFCARKTVLLLRVWDARKDQFAALSDRIMNLNVSCRKRFLLASERRIVGRVRTDRIIGFVFRAVLGIMPGWWVGGHGVDGVEWGRSTICAAFHSDIRMSAGGGETSWNEKFEHENVRKNCRKVTLSQFLADRRIPSLGNAAWSPHLARAINFLSQNWKTILKESIFHKFETFRRTRRCYCIHSHKTRSVNAARAGRLVWSDVCVPTEVSSREWHVNRIV
jgi:hypothetical protein